MTDLVLRDIDPQLAARIRKVSETNGWTLHETILHLIERGLFASEGGALRFDSSETDVMQSVIAALETVPNDPGFALIGRTDAPAAAPHDPRPATSFDQAEIERFLDSVPKGAGLGQGD